MIITTNSLNNIETKITTPQIGGIEFIDAVLNDGVVTGINASYNDIIDIIGIGKLPIIIINGNQRKSFEFICNISFDNPSYIVSTINGYWFTAQNATTNMI